MNPRWRHRLRRAWFAVGGTLAVLAIALAALMALGQLLLPLVAQYPKRVAHLLGERIGQPVSFASIDGYWQPSGPLLVLHHVHIGQHDGKPALTLPSAKVKLDFGALLWPSRHWINLRLSGLRLQLLRDDDGHWHVAGFGVAGQGGGQRVSLDDLPGNLWLDDLELDIDDAGNHRRFRVRAGPLRVSNSGGTLRFAGLLRRGDDRGQPVKVAGRARDGGRDGRLYLSLRDTNLGNLFQDAGLAGYAVDAGQGDLQLWLGWRDRRLAVLTVDADLENLALRGPAGPVRIPSLRGLVQYRRDGDDARVLFAPADRGAARVDLTRSKGGLQVEMRAHDLAPGGWLLLGSLAPGLPAPLARWIAVARPHVHLADAHVRWSRQRGIEAVEGRFDHFGFAAAGKTPGVSDVHGELRGDVHAVSVHLPEQPLTLDFARVFRQPLVFSSVGGNMVAWRGAGIWHLGSDAVRFRGKGLSGQLRGSLRLVPGQAPYLDLYASLGRMKVAAAKQFWPVHVMSEHTVQWLDHGLVSGTLEDASVLLHGSMADWPFTNHHGRFEAHADISGLDLDYDPRWPRATDVAVEARFVDDGMFAVVSGGQVHGVKVKKAVASIPDFDKAELVLHAQGSGSGHDMLDFVRTSPIGKAHADVLSGLKLGGGGHFDFSMVVPLSRRAPGELALAGTVHLDDADVDDADWKLHLGSLDGDLAFDRHGFRAQGLSATYQGQPVRLDMAVGPGTGHPSWPLRVDMQGRFSLAQLARGRERLEPLAKMGQGSALFDIGFHIDKTAGNPLHRRQVLSVQSDLQGMALDLPAPLHKPAQASLPLHLQLGLPVEGGPLRVVLGDKLRARARLPAPDRPGAVDVRLGGAALADAMPAQGIRIRGEAPRMDLSGWVRYALSASGGPGADIPPLQVDVTADHAEIFDHDFKKLHVEFHPAPDEWKLAVDGPALKGSLTVPLHDIDKRGIVARFDRLYWPSPDQGKAGTAAPAAPASAASAVSPPPVPRTMASGVAPSSLPPLHLWVGDLRFGDARLGQARVESWPTAQGMHIDMLRAQSRSMHMAASGDWNGTAQASQTHLTISFTADNLGHMLDAFGYDGLFIGGETQAHLDATWPGSPAAFELANVEGTLGVKIGQGRIPEVKPGMGRLFGLMSIAELPRRLTLDFGDVFGKGFGFDSIQGHFRFHDGNAWTKDLAIKGPAADITVTGRVGLRTHDYDQYVLAIPHVGNSLPIVGAVVAGPVGAAAGLAMQGILGKGINKAASARYHITGPWDKPVITLVEKHAPQAVAVPPAPATTVPARPASTPVPAAGAPARPASVPVVPSGVLPAAPSTAAKHATKRPAPEPVRPAR